MDDFKNYINQHKEHLDIDIPSKLVWENIERELEPQKGKVFSLVLKWAAAACVILLAGFAVYLFSKNESDDRLTLAKTLIPEESILKKDTKLREEEQAEVVENQLLEEDDEDKPTPKQLKASSEKLEDIIAKERIEKKPADNKPPSPMVKAFNDMEASYASMVNIQMERIKGTPIYAEDANYFYVFKKQFQDLNSDEKLLKQETQKTGINDDIITRMINIYQEKISLLKQLQSEINKMNNRLKNSNEEVHKIDPTYINL